MTNPKYLGRFNLYSFVGLLLAAVMAGCGGGGPKRYAVTGTVTLKGQNLDKGNIMFAPAEGSGTQQGAEIVNGSYQLAAKDGLLPGKYKVSISSPEGGASGGAIDLPGDPAEAKPATEKIPEKYNAKTELTADITAGGENKFDFKLD